MNYFKLDRATVSCVVQMLEAAGWIVRSRGVPTRRIGRPTEMLWINSNAGLFLGLAFEANLIWMVAAGLDGKPRANLTFPNVPGARPVWPSNQTSCSKYSKSMRSGTRLVRHVGWGVPAPIDSDGRILPDPYFGAKDFAIIPKLQSLIQVPVLTRRP
jgi:hypothetical protein